MTRCRGITRSGARCRNDAIKGKTYCGIASHKSRQVSTLRVLLSHLVSYQFFGVVLAIVGIAIGIISYNAYLEDKKVQTTTGALQSSEKAEQRIIAIGSARLIVDSSDDILLRDGDDSLITVRMIDRKMYVSTVIRNMNGEIVAQLRDNEWHLNRRNYYDRNFNEQAIEVVNHSGKVVLQVVNLGDVIHLACMFHRKDGSPFALIPVGKYGALMAVRGSGPPYVVLSSSYMYENKEERLPDFGDSPEIPKIFAYPSNLHLGSCPGLKDLTELIRMADSSSKYKGYRLGSSLDIGLKKLPQ